MTSLRPPPEKRTFTSPVLEQALARTAAQIADPGLRWLFENCLPNTLDTTVTHTPDDGGGADTFIITGDIDAMWLRDSANQVWPYLPFARECPNLRALFRGLIRRQCRCVLLDPYANAFYRTEGKISQWQSDHTDMKPGIHERKYELDSLASVLRLATGYYEATGDRVPFGDPTFVPAIRLILQTITNEQAGTPEQINPHYSFARTTANATDTLPNGGHGNPVKRTGMSRSPFRPSDDATIFQYHVPANAMASIMLRKTVGLLLDLSVHGLQLYELAAEARDVAEVIARAIHQHAIITDPVYNDMFAYEIDGFGSQNLMDDANLPNLLSLPYLAASPVSKRDSRMVAGLPLGREYFADPSDPIYQNTRRFILSDANPYFHKGSAVPHGGVGGPHIGLGWVWPLGIITQALTSTDDAEILHCLHTLKTAHTNLPEGSGFMHEAFWMDNPARFTRGWFAWANTYFGELILHLAKERPHLLAQIL